MIKEDKNINFYTTGRQPSEQDFTRISEWIKKDKQKQAIRKLVKQTGEPKHLTHRSITKGKA